MNSEMPLDPGLHDSVLSKVVEQWAASDPNRICIVQDDGESVTYAQLNQYASSLAHGMAALGVVAGDRVVSLIGNDIKNVCLTLALGKLGAIEVPVNTALIGASLKHVIDDSDPRLVVVDVGLRERLVEVLTEQSAPRIIQVQAAGDGEDADGPSMDELLAQPGDLLETTVSGKDSASIMYTSGTTGLPKGALLSHRHTFRICERSAMGFSLGTEDTLLTILPLFHAGGKYMDVGACLLAGARCYLVRRFSASSFWRQACESRATVAHALVSIVHFLIAQKPSDEEKNHEITRALIAPVTPQVADICAERFGIKIFQGYASTECNLAVLNDISGDIPVTACGRVIPPYRIRIVDEDDCELSAGEIGEIVVSCDEPWSVFTGYWNQPEITLETLRNFGVHSGDAGYLDENGHLYFVDRIKDVIRRRGENIATQTIEDAINAIPGIVESAAYAVPSEYGEDEIAVAIVAAPQVNLDASKVESACCRTLPHFAVPRYLRFVEALPKTETGKIQKFKLKREGVSDAVLISEEKRKAVT